MGKAELALMQQLAGPILPRGIAQILETRAFGFQPALQGPRMLTEDACDGAEIGHFGAHKIAEDIAHLVGDRLPTGRRQPQEKAADETLQQLVVLR